MAYAKLSSSMLVCKEPSATAPKQSTAAGITLIPEEREEARLLAGCLKALKLPTFLRDWEEAARQCAAQGLGHPRYLLRLAEAELAERHGRKVERLVKQARFPAVKSLDEFEFERVPGLDKGAVLELAECEYVARRENVVAVGPGGTGKTHIALGLGLAACRKGISVGFTTVASLTEELVEARAEKRLVRLERRLDACSLLIIDELGYAPLSAAGAELFFEVVSRRCERGSIILTSSLPMQEWVGIFGSERLTAALLDRLSRRLHVIETDGESYRLEHGEPPAASPFVFAKLAG